MGATVGELTKDMALVVKGDRGVLKAMVKSGRVIQTGGQEGHPVSRNQRKGVTMVRLSRRASALVREWQEKLGEDPKTHPRRWLKRRIARELEEVAEESYGMGIDDAQDTEDM